MQSVTLTVNLKDGTVNKWQNIPLPCPVSTNGSETTSLDAFADTSMSLIILYDSPFRIILAGNFFKTVKKQFLGKTQKLLFHCFKQISG